MTENEEMYLVHIAQERESSTGPIPLRVLADNLDILPASVNQMIKKLESDGKVSYTPYKGVVLTEKGKALATKILRSRRLWEVFLTDHLKFTPQKANEIACGYEHVTPEEVTERLATFLGHPSSTAQGKSIPGVEGNGRVELGSPLSVITAGEQVQVLGLQSKESERAFLRQSGITPGSYLIVLAMKADGTCLIQPQQSPMVQLSPQLSHWVRVTPVTDNETHEI